MQLFKTFDVRLRLDIRSGGEGRRRREVRGRGSCGREYEGKRACTSWRVEVCTHSGWIYTPAAPRVGQEVYTPEGSSRSAEKVGSCEERVGKLGLSEEKG